MLNFVRSDFDSEVDSDALCDEHLFPVGIWHLGPTAAKNTGKTFYEKRFSTLAIQFRCPESRVGACLQKPSEIEAVLASD
ncbi:hypothetical protein NMY22_g19371 [Coprinellus aureogranulatus]|nr:hypothetical protein NMY22_g19371 [Coprinellus aureogranulatus]